MKELHFCSGLPRSGSTLLLNILQQNPSIFTTSTDPVADMIISQIATQSRGIAFLQAMDPVVADNAMHGFVVNGCKGWYESLTDKPLVISKNRHWPGLQHTFKESKYIVTVRDLCDIVDSFCRLNNKVKILNTFADDMSLLPGMSDDEIFDVMFRNKNISVYRAVNVELPRLTKLYINNPDRVYFLRYEDLLRNPLKQIQDLYNFLGIQGYKHDLNNIEQQSMFEHDNAYYRERTTHKTSPVLQEWKKPNRFISDYLQSRIKHEYKSFYDSFYPEEIK